jgi:hypothetical protein
MNRRTDGSWNGGCETITRTGKRAGLKCNGRFYATKNVNGREIKSCYMHRDGFHQDVENEESFYDDEDNDEINESDLSFIAPEDDGTYVINGRVFGGDEESNPFNPETDRERENHNKYDLPYINLVSDSESEYVPETEEDDKMEYEAQGQIENIDTYWRDEYFKEKQRNESLEVQLMQERNKLEEYKKIITESISDSDDEKLKVLRLKNRVSDLKKQVMELFDVFMETIES